MGYVYIAPEVDINEVFDQLSYRQQKNFIKDNLDIIDIDDIINYLEDKGYTITDK